MSFRPFSHEVNLVVKSLAVIGASYLQRPLVEKAKEMGLRVICFAWREGAVCSEIADVFYPVSIVEKEEILRICREERIDGVCTIASDVAAPTVAFVAEQMGLPGNSYEASLRANNKFLMREAFSKAGIRCPRYQLVTCTDDIIQTEWTYPVIVKPCDRSGSLGVLKVESSMTLVSAAENALQCSFKRNAIIEEYIEGREVSVEFISHNGHHYPLTITDKVTTGAPHFVELEHHQPASLSQELYDEIYDTNARALDALGIKEGASHTEYRITNDGKVYIIELGGRMGGDFIGSDLVRLSTGYDFVKGVIQVALGDFDAPDLTEKRYSGVYFLCKETERLASVIDAPEQAPFVYLKERTDSVLRPVTCSADRSGYLIYQSDHKIVL